MVSPSLPLSLLTAGRKGENRCENPAARLSVTKLAVSGEQESRVERE